jgi:S-formylglutathione hydrolase FrmB
MLIRKRLTFVIIFVAFFCFVSNILVAQQGRIVEDKINSASLEGNLLNDPATRPMAIYLPRSYDEGDKLYPVIYYLHAYSNDYTMWSSDIKSVVDDLIQQSKVQDMIIVMPDATNKYGGSWYSNSSVAGNYEDYITKDLVKFIDSKYRTLQQRESRAIGGGSMGGYGAMKLAMKHPEVYCAVVSHSGLLSINHWKDIVRANPQGMQSLAIAWSPNPNSDSLCDYPADNKGNLIEDVWNRWLENDVVSMVKSYQGNLKKLAGIYFDHGKQDTTVNISEAQEFDKVLTEAGISHIYEEYAGGHGDQWNSRLYIAIPFLSNLLSSEVLTSVEPKGKLTTIWGEMKR